MQHESYHGAVTDLERLTDAELCALVARAQSVLLDRPGTVDGAPLLTVEVVVREEAWLLAHYRALSQRGQRSLLASLDSARRDAAMPAPRQGGDPRHAGRSSDVSDGRPLPLARNL